MRRAILAFLRALTRPSGLAVGLALPLVAMVGCFEYDEPNCSFKCGC